MSLIIENIDTVNVTIDDLGIFLSPSQQYDLAQDEANSIYMSTDLPSAISGGQIRVYDPLDDVTPLSTSDALEAISLMNDTHFRIKGGELNQLDDVVTTSVANGDFLRYNGSNFVVTTTSEVENAIVGSPQPFVHLTGDENIAGEKRFVDEIRVGGSAVSDLQITFNGPDGPAAGYAIRQVGIGSPQVFPGTLFFMDTAAFPQILMGSNEANTVAAFLDVDNDGTLFINSLHTGPVVIGPGGLLPDDPDTAIGSAGAPWGLIHTDDEIRFHETAAGSPVNYVSFSAPTSITSDITWTLPTTDSTGTQALVSDGAGTLSWQTIGTAQSHLYRHNSTTTQTFGGTPILVNFGTNVRTDSDYTHATVTGGSQITINTTGWYKIECEVAVDNGNNSRSTAATGIFVNSTLVAHSLGFSYHRNAASGEGVCFSTVKLNLTATDTVDVQIAQIAGGGALTTLSNSCRLNIESIDGP